MVIERKPRWLWESTTPPGDRYVYCDHHNYWYRESQGCYMCTHEGRKSIPSLRRF